MLELVDSGRHLESLKENALLSLDSDVLGPGHKSCHVFLGLDVAADAEVLWPSLHQRVHCFFFFSRMGRNNFPHCFLGLTTIKGKTESKIKHTRFFEKGGAQLTIILFIIINSQNYFA